MKYSSKLAERFQRPVAIAGSVSMIVAVLASTLILCAHEEELKAAFLSACWFAVLLLLPTTLLPLAVKTPNQWFHPVTLLVILCCLGLLVIPRHEEIRRVLPACGTLSAASVLCVPRVLTVLFDREGFREWSISRLVYYVCAFGWHDFRTAKLLQDPKGKMISILVVRQLSSIFVAFACVAVVFVAGPPHLASSDIVDVLKLVSHVLFRGILSAGAFYNAFVALDASLRLSYVVLLGVDVEAAFGVLDFPALSSKTQLGRFLETLFYRLSFNCKSVASFWGRFWNRPVHALLANGVYMPLISAGISERLATLCVFLVSGAGHLYACNAAGLATYTQICMLAFFLVQPLYISLERTPFFRRHLRGPTFVFFAVAASTPLFTEPLLGVFGYGIRVDPSMGTLSRLSGF